MKFLNCENCNGVLLMIKGPEKFDKCCVKELKEIIPESVDASKEKHLPLVKVQQNKVFVDVGSDKHPMSKNHLIEWVAIETTNGLQIKYLKADDEPSVCFTLCENEKLISTYSYCNLHGLWKI